MKTSSIRKLTLSLAAAGSIVSQGILRADPGDDNPTGVAGWFNGQVQSGCSFDPLTGNEKRQILDILVPGSVSEYPLAFTRTMNSRVDSTIALHYPFGRAARLRPPVFDTMEFRHDFG
jgi:hypothetical protein